MIEVGVHEAKTTLSKLLKRVALGDEVVITSRGHPVARLVPAIPAPGPRVLGEDAGSYVVGPDFDEPLPDDVADAFGA